jgi:hypothetical protein
MLSVHMPKASVSKLWEFICMPDFVGVAAVYYAAESSR